MFQNNGHPTYSAIPTSRDRVNQLRPTPGSLMSRLEERWHQRFTALTK